MSKVISCIVVTALIVFASCQGGQKQENQTQQQDTIHSLATNFFSALPDKAPSPENKINPEKVLLGKILFYDTRLSAKGNNSCNSCHNLATYGVDNKPTSTGDEGLKGARNSPTVYNAALAFVQFWDGRAKDVEEQAGGPILNPVEMNIHDKEYLEKRLASIDGYYPLFKAAFPEENEPISYRNLQLAIGAFERTLLTPAPFDEYLSGGKDALTDQEKAGLHEFITTGCITCHSGVLLGGNMYQKFGIFAPYNKYTGVENPDPGRYAVTNNSADSNIFKVPTLRNINETYPYFHDGSVQELEDAIKIMAKVQLNKDLGDDTVRKIASFLSSLTGKIPPYALEIPELPGS